MAKLKDWRRIPNNATSLAAELASTGPLSVALDATIAFQFYHRGVLKPDGLIGGCGKNPELNHAVLLVGFGTDGGKDYWTVKNSWGPKWGEVCMCVHWLTCARTFTHAGALVIIVC